MIAELKAADAAKKAVCDNMNSTASYKTYGVQDKQRSISQSVGQSVSQPKKGFPPAKRSKFDRSQSDPGGSSQNNYAHMHAWKALKAPRPHIPLNYQ